MGVQKEKTPQFSEQIEGGEISLVRLDSYLSTLFQLQKLFSVEYDGMMIINSSRGLLGCDTV
jgi:hypothetical protein